jgi:hypothetical protein
MMVNIPYIQKTETHWKVGDKIDDNQDSYIIGQLILVEVSDDSFSLEFYDQEGELRGDMFLTLKGE